MITFIPLGPPTPKKPKPKQHKFTDDLYGYTSCGEELEEGVELFAWSEEHLDFLPVETNTYTTHNGIIISVVDGVIV
jgi:hypothetical protein